VNKDKKGKQKKNDDDDCVTTNVRWGTIVLFVTMNLMRACRLLMMILHYTLHRRMSSSHLIFMVILEH